MAEIKKCLNCLKDFKPKHKEQIYCSIKCVGEVQRKTVEQRYCVCCGKPIERYKHNGRLEEYKRYAKRKYCSYECRMKDIKSYYKPRTLSEEEKERRAVEVERKEYSQAILNVRKVLVKLVKLKQYELDCISECKECGEIFQGNRKGLNYCSDKCRRKHNNRLNTYNKERRLYKNGKPDLSITLSKLYKRDNGICKSCGVVCDWNDVVVRDDGVIVAGESYPSIDHIIPLSKGGLHQWNNVQLMCRHCNCVIKRDKLV